MDRGAEGPTVVRNRFYAGIILLGSTLGLFIALCLAILALASLFPLKQLTAQRGVDALLWAAFSAYGALMGISWWGRGRRMAFYSARLDERGVDFHLGTRRHPDTCFFPWAEISAVRHERRGIAHYFMVLGRDGSSVEFSSYAFARPKRLARLIAEHAGQSIQEA
jgi:hypothetical protein